MTLKGTCMAITGDDPISTAEDYALPWTGRSLLAASTTGTWGDEVGPGRRGVPLEYAVMTQHSAFPAGWVRFNAELDGYAFCSLLPGREAVAGAYSDPQHAVPAWVGKHVLRVIHPIPEDLSGDMLAAAPAMLALLKQVRALLAKDESRLPALDLDDLDHVLAIAEGRG